MISHGQPRVTLVYLVFFSRSSTLPKPFKWTFQTSEEASTFSKILFEDFFVAAEFVSGGFQNILKNEDTRVAAVQTFLENYLSIQLSQARLSAGVVSGEVVNLCKDLLNLCRKSLRRFSRVIAGGFFYNETDAALEDLGTLIYLSNTSKEFEKGKIKIFMHFLANTKSVESFFTVFSWLRLMKWSEEKSNGLPLGVSLQKICFERSIWNLFSDTAQLASINCKFFYEEQRRPSVRIKRTLLAHHQHVLSCTIIVEN